MNGYKSEKEEEMKSTEIQNRRILINPKGSEKIYETMQFSQAIRVDNTVWVSGQVGVDELGAFGEGIEAQARLAFQNLKRILAGTGASLDDVVELVTYHTSMADIRKFSEVKSEFITRNYPAWTAVAVSALVFPQILVEIKATAVVGSSEA